jgi:hypothetical protein
LVEDWITVSFQDRAHIKQKIQDNIYRESEVVQSEKRKRSKLPKNNRKSKKRDMKRRHRKK